MKSQQRSVLKRCDNGMSNRRFDWQHESLTYLSQGEFVFSMFCCVGSKEWTYEED